MSSNVTNIIVAGIGGQGVLKASDILSDVVFRAGYDVKKSEIHGMSQRGGSVASDVRFGEQVFSPMVPPGEADFLVLLESEQREANAGRLRPQGMLIAPEMLEDPMLRVSKSLNVALLGILSAHLPIDLSIWEQAVRANLPEKFFDVNWKAFLSGRECKAGISA